MPRTSTLLLVSMPFSLAAAASPPVIVGLGNATCEVAMAPAHRERSFDYIWGVWTGMNMAANKPVGHSTNSNGILKEVVLGCLSYPKLPLADAVLGVHMRFEKENR